MEKKNLYILIKNILTRKVDPEEEKLMDQHLYKYFHQEEWDSERFGDRDEIENRILDSVNKKVGQNTPVIPNRRNWILYAAAITIFLSIAITLYTYLNFNKSDGDLSSGALASKDSVLAPGDQHASLVLNDGTIVKLDELESGEKKTVANLTITKNAQGNLEYSVNNKASAGLEEMNTLTTPLCGTYKIILEDGSQVWLNSGSTITFPTVFNAIQRKVEITGEAYFEVAHNAKVPFVVKVDGLDIQVLGTSFNVSAYKDSKHQNNLSVALLTGAVALKKNNTTTKLVPGKKATVDHENINISAFDVESEVAWKDNYFVFKDQNIKTIMDELARWYKAEVVYDGDNWSDKNFTLRMSRDQEIKEILTLIELTRNVKFKIKGRRIIVST